jgi:hypothetical protein
MEEDRLHTAECHGLWSSKDDDSESEEDVLSEQEGEQTEPSTSLDDKYPDDDDASAGEVGKMLAHQAEAGLKEILRQYKVDTEDFQRVIGRFQGFLVEAPSDLPMKPIPKKDRYPWAVVGKIDAEWGILADIAMRFEALVCNEAVSERTNGMMRRFLCPFRLRMGRKTLLSRLTVAKHGSSAIDPKESEDCPE